MDQTEGAGGAGFYQDYYANQEISVSAAGQDVTANTPGALVQVTVKSGGNQFKGLFNQTYEGRDFVGNNIDEETAARGFTGQPNLVISRDPRRRRRPNRAQTSCGSSTPATTSASTRRSRVFPRRSPPTSASSTTTRPRKPGSRPSNDTFIGYYQHQHKQQPKRGLSVTTGPGSTLAQSSYAWMGNGRWQRVWSNRLFSEVNVGQWGYNFPLLPTTDYR